MAMMRMCKATIAIHEDGWEQNLSYLQRDVLELCRENERKHCVDPKTALIARMADVLDRYQLILRNAYKQMDIHHE